MKKVVVIFAVLFSLLFLTTSVLAAAYMKFDSIQGESKAEGHEGWIEIESFKHGLSRAIKTPVSGERSTSGTSLSDVTVTMEIDKATPALFTNSCVGEPTEEVKIDFVKPAPAREESYLKYKFTDVIICI